jgi:hypothetical protein
MLKKMMLLAMAVGVLVAFAAPTVASAHNWTSGGAKLEKGATASETYEGVLSFTTPAPPLPVESSFGCEVTVAVEVTGTGGGTGHGEVTEFNPTTASCAGTGVFKGCTLANDVSNPPWDVDILATNLRVNGPVTITNTYAAGCPAGAGSELTFGPIAGATTNGGGGGIEKITISGLASNGLTVTSGTLHAESGEVIGVDY